MFSEQFSRQSKERENHVISTTTTQGRIFDPSKLLDVIKEQFEVQTDSELAELLNMTSPQISRIRNWGAPLSASALIKIHEVSGLPIERLKKLCGDRRASQRVRRSPGGPTQRRLTFEGDAHATNSA